MDRSLRVLRDRFEISGLGWRGWCCFSYDQHYDPGNVSFGRMLACNEFLLEPGAGFGMHRHSDVDVVTTVLSGVLTHVPGERRPPGSYVWSTGTGAEHDERNDGDAPVRFVQAFLLPDGAPPVDLVGDAELAAMTHVLVLDGAFSLLDEELGPGDSARLAVPGLLTGSGRALAWQV